MFRYVSSEQRSCSSTVYPLQEDEPETQSFIGTKRQMLTCVKPALPRVLTAEQNKAGLIQMFLYLLLTGVNTREEDCVLFLVLKQHNSRAAQTNPNTST